MPLPASGQEFASLLSPALCHCLLCPCAFMAATRAALFSQLPRACLPLSAQSDGAPRRPLTYAREVWGTRALAVTPRRVQHGCIMCHVMVCLVCRCAPALDTAAMPLQRSWLAAAPQLVSAGRRSARPQQQRPVCTAGCTAAAACPLPRLSSRHSPGAAPRHTHHW